MYVVLAVDDPVGLGNTLLGNVLGQPANYREHGLALVPLDLLLPAAARPDGRRAGLGFQMHALSACVLFAIWPFTRLVHVFSAPLGYLTRPYIVYRSREPGAGARAPGAAGRRSAPATGPDPCPRRRRPSRGGRRCATRCGRWTPATSRW